MALLKGAEGFPPIEGLTGKASEGTYFILVFPHTTLTLTTDSVAMTERWPMGPLCTRLVHCAYFPKKIAERDDFEKIVLNYYKRWDKTLSEDIRAAERQQVGVSSAFDARGRFSYRETLVHSANNWWLDRVLGQRSVS
jgi:phenylpropionate dioxygenase-like ring-hydroxylating dioxygenase large terminal subunit